MGLKKVFLTYFDDVQVVPPGQSRDPNPHVIADVKLERVEVTLLGRGFGVAALQWGLGILASESDDYL
ncbi:MAG: hypothetical protein ABW123_20520 [Cystobacter sp.]